MRRSIASLAGFFFGVILTWICLFTFNNISWSTSGRRAHSCVDAGDCSWLGISMLIGYIFLFPLLFGVLNGVAWRRWTIRKWLCWLLIFSFLTVTIHLIGHL